MVEALGDRVGDRGGLLVDLLQHERLVAALRRHLERVVGLLDRVLARLAVRDADEAHVVARRDHDLALVDDLDAARLLEEGGRERGEERVAVAAADDERRPGQARADDAVGLVARDGEEREVTLEARVEAAARLGEVAVVLLLDQVHERLGVGVRRERVALGGDLRAQLDVVLEDAVHQHGEAAVLGQERVRVALLHPAVRGPAGVAHADRGRGREVARRRAQVRDRADGPCALEPGVGDHHHAGGVVPAVLEMLESRQDELLAGARPDVPDDPAHTGNPTVRSG